MSIEIPKDKHNNLMREERGALFDLKNDKTIVIKGMMMISRTGRAILHAQTGQRAQEIPTNAA